MEDKETNTFDQENQDDFGLPEVKYEPLDREVEETDEFDEPQYYERDDEEEEEEGTSGNNKGLIVFGIISVLIVAALSMYLFLFGGMEQVSGWFADEPEPAPVTQVVEEPEPEPEPLPDPEPIPEVDPLAPYSEISTISEPSGRSFVVVASFVDDDLARDFSNELMAQDIGSKILAPTSRAPLMHRVAVADFGTFQEAMNEVALFRNKYGDQTWVLKY